jgi:hypothetical protein
MIQGWFRKAGFDVGLLVDVPIDPNAGQDRCTLPADATFLRREHVLCVDRAGITRREKRVRHTTWSRYDKADDIDGELVNVSVVKRKGVKRAAPVNVDDCAPPDDPSKTRWVGLQRPAPAGLTHGSSDGLFSNEDDSFAIEAIIGERQVGGNTEYKVRWVGFNATHDSWLKEDEFSIGFQSTLKHWRERNKRQSERKEMKEHKEEAERPKAKYKANRNAKVASTIAIYSAKTASKLFYIARVIAILPDSKLRIHWWASKKVDGTYSAEFKKPKQKQKGTAGPYLATVQKSSVIDRVISLDGKTKGKIGPAQLRQITRLATEFRARDSNPQWYPCV